jgi:peptidyl-tRNA hydrolase, PTH2 family
MALLSEWMRKCGKNVLDNAGIVRDACLRQLKKMRYTGESGIYRISAMKQAIVIRTDLQMSTGKLAVQACHASVAAVLCAGADVLKRWENDGQTKIALAVHSLSELETLKTQCETMEIIHALISDAGRTELAEGTVTALAIGPAEDKAVDRITGAIPLLK